MLAASSTQPGLRRVIRLWYGVALIGLAFYTASTVFGVPFGLDDLFNRWLYNALILLGVAACLIRTVRVRDERAAWLVMTLAVGAWALGEIFYDFVYAGDPPYPSVGDVFYLAFYPIAYVAMMLLVRERFSGFSRSVWLDGATAAMATGAVGAAVLFEVVLESTEGSLGVVVTNLAYPLGDILLLSAVVGVIALSGGRLERTWLLLGLGLAASAVADGIFLYQSATNSYTEGTVLDAMWPASLLALCAAAWQRPQRAAVTLEERPLLAIPFACSLTGLGVLTYDHFHRLNALALGLAVGTIGAVVVRTAMTFGENRKVLELMRHHAATDPLTGLRNRRELGAELDAALAAGAGSESRLLAIFDLDGFKRYNDTFGHPAGDALLTRLAANLAAVVGDLGSSYRLGGDEFCVLANTSPAKAGAFLDVSSAALSEEGEAFTVTSSFGAVFLPEDASTPAEALRLADQRLYAQKRRHIERGRPHEMLLQALYEREPDLKLHVQGVGEMAGAVGRALELSADKLEELRLAARLHDVGKLAIPDAVLQKPGPLDVNEWAFIKEHTVIGERILSASPALAEVGRIVRSTHERWDGEGYPDRVGGEEIPLAARIIAVCDAFSAMTSVRPYRVAASWEAAIAELRRCAGTQFDPEVVAVFCEQAARAADEGWQPMRAADAA